MWLFTGILIGLGLAWYLAAKGYIPQPQSGPQAGEIVGAQGDEALPSDEISKAPQKPGKPRYDFFTVLPEMEVVVPEQELAERREPDATKPVNQDADSYLLQVGSFKSSDDAEQMKAQLALSGITATVQSVTVNDATWHRVRVGPVQGAQKADEIRRRLQSNGIESLVMKNP
jgi:cell division protein FtsN